MITDKDFDLVYSPAIRALSSRHWTSIKIVKKAVNFLCYKENTKILDVGSGVGKFSILGALLKASNFFYGVDFRKDFIEISDNLKKEHRIENVFFLHNYFDKIDFNNFDGIYFFNSFHERIDKDTVIDELSEFSYDLYKKYTQEFFLKINSMSEGTRLVTYHTEDIHIPYTYRIVDMHFEGKLKFYIKCLDEGDLE
ncbi:MAG: class I SAM-dependent methyltransferase [Cytophagaceae bacterium]|nr:class I SAM-dependent methyltransferase [Cytophagaceae bacterium]